MNMRTRRIAFRESFSILYMALYVAALTVLAPAAQAVDISWHRTTRLVWSEGPRTRHEGNITFANGERAICIAEATDGPMDSNNWITFKGQEVMRFDDRSMIFMQFEGRGNEGTRVAAFEGTFLSGTGRFKGVVGSFKCAGKFREYDCTGSYSLPTK